MTREIKFRAWEIETQQWNNDYKILLNGTIKDFDWDDDGYFEFEVPKEEYVIEQYTGLKDKNGVEIYEGDIVEQFVCGIHEFKGKKCGRRTIWEVRWNKKECCFELHYLSGSLFGDSMMSDGDEYEIIGNIHKNKGLLGAEE